MRSRSITDWCAFATRSSWPGPTSTCAWYSGTMSYRSWSRSASSTCSTREIPSSAWYRREPAVEAARSSGNVGSVSTAEGALRSGLNGLYAVAERYPEAQDQCAVPESAGPHQHARDRDRRPPRGVQRCGQREQCAHSDIPRCDGGAHVRFSARAAAQVHHRADQRRRSEVGLRPLEMAAQNPELTAWMIAGLAVLATAYALLRFFGFVRRDRFVEDTPLVRIRSAAQGYVRVEGQATPPADNAITSPLSSRACVWWNYQIAEKHRDSRGRTEWTTVDQAQSVTPFVLADMDGQCLVGPVGADVTPTSHDVWYGDTPKPTGPPAQPGVFLALEKKLPLYGAADCMWHSSVSSRRAAFAVG